ncbi:MAG: type I restriction-modification system subunit M N-terminal domain-containing protein [Verrucomicrobiota bacterium]
MANHHELANFIWQIADLLRGPYRPPQYERVMLPMTVLRRFDCVLAPTKEKVLREYEKRKGGKLNDEALDKFLSKAAGQRFHNHSPLTFEKLKGDPDNIEKHLASYINGFSANVRRIFEYFEFTNEIEKLREANLLYLAVSKFCDVDLHPNRVSNSDMGLVFENLIRRFNELANETAGDHFTPRDVIGLMVNLLFIHDDDLLARPGTVRKLLDPTCGTGGMLAEAQKYLHAHHRQAELYVYGQDYNKRSYAVVALPEQMFYNTGIGTYIWIVTNRKGKIQLFDARETYLPMRRSLGDKRRKLGEGPAREGEDRPEEPDQIADIVKLYGRCKDGDTSKVFDNADFGYTRVTVERPLRLRYQMTLDNKARFLDACPHLLDDVQAIDKELGREPQLDWNAVWSRIDDLLRSRKTCWKAAEQKLFRSVFTKKDPAGERVAQDGESSEFEPDADLRDFENVPLKEAIDAYFAREVLPHVTDAWMDRAKDKVGYDINFNRHYYRYTAPRDLAEIDADLKQSEENFMRLLKEVTA